MFLNLQTYSTQYEFSMLVMILLTPGWDSMISFILFYFLCSTTYFLGALLHCGGRNNVWSNLITVATRARPHTQETCTLSGFKAFLYLNLSSSRH